MAFIPQFVIDPVSPCWCPACGWEGTFAASVIQVDDYVRCPECNRPVERDLSGPEPTAARERPSGNCPHYHPHPSRN